ncbi:MAG TPA: sigma-54 dependent transcriptional regulator [Pyrinomonadaceae bacterium]|nr:sigma-54 dependent transcriptional regulator [Pyrinomonadaceae bacterium]
MRPRTALLVESGANGNSVRAALQAILEPDFRLEVLVPPLVESVDVLKKSLQQIDAALLFLTLFPKSLNQTRTLLKTIQQIQDLPVVMVVESAQPNDIIELLKAGADDFITLPLQAGNVLPRAWKFGRKPGTRTRARIRTKPAMSRLIGESSVFLNQIEKIPQIARCDANVLITGETGTGKELYARAIHYCSSRAGRPFMPVNCGAIPGELVENELFGHERGAFTSAVTLQTGLVEEANGGTLFLDEVDCLPTFAQVKLLRFLQEKEYRPLGASRMRQANVRVIAASNVNLEEAVGNGKVRQDLFYRLNVIALTLPPLRERLEDIPLLARHFLEKYSREMNKEVPDLQADALQIMMAHGWPGNIRELEHAIERVTVLCDGPVIRGSDLILVLPSGTAGQSLQEAKATQIARFEKSYIQGLLRGCRGNISKAARLAQKNRRAFWQLIQKHQIDVESFRSNV